MSAASLLNRVVRKLDEVCSGVQIRVAERRGGLISIFLHNVFTDVAEIERDLAYPQQDFTVAHLRQVIEYFQGAGHRFVTGDEVIAGLPSDGRYVMLSFDDGYFNNLRALPVLEKYQVPALFYIPAQLVAEGRAFWWDVLYRTRRRAGHGREQVFTEIARRVAAQTENIEAQLTRELGVSEFKPASDTDRLFTPAELHQFAAHPLVRIGNHGCVHEHLTSYPIAVAADRIQRAQKLLHELTGQTPTAIAYPYGAVSNEVVKASREAGLRLGVTTILRKEYVRQLADENHQMRVSRFTVWGNSEVAAQCRWMRGDLMLSTRYRTFVEKFKGSQAAREGRSEKRSKENRT